MEQEKDKFLVIGEIYSQFSEDSKDKLARTAKALLKVQMEDADMLANTGSSIEKQTIGLSKEF